MKRRNVISIIIATVAAAVLGTIPVFADSFVPVYNDLPANVVNIVWDSGHSGGCTITGLPTNAVCGRVWDSGHSGGCTTVTDLPPYPQVGYTYGWFNEPINKITSDPPINITGYPPINITSCPPIPSGSLHGITFQELEKYLQDNNITVNPSDISSSDFTETEKKIYELANSERVKNGLASLTLDKTLTEMAEFKAKDMAANGFSHDGSYGDFGNLLSMYKVSYSAAAENIAMGQSTPKEVMTSWMNSQGHRENILNGKFRKLGVGFAEAGNTTYWVMEFTD